MTPLQAARQLFAQSWPPMDEMEDCLYCQGGIAPVAPWQHVHAPKCPWVHRRQIVAALEAAERLMAVGPPVDSRGFAFCEACLDFYAGEEYPVGRKARYVERDHSPDCPRGALVTALRGTT